MVRICLLSMIGGFGVGAACVYLALMYGSDTIVAW